MFSLEIGQVLITTTNEKATIVEITDSTIKLYFKGRVYIRPKSIIGEKLFITSEDKQKREIIEKKEQRKQRKKEEQYTWLNEIKKSIGENKNKRINEDN